MMNWENIEILIPQPGQQPDYQSWLEAFPTLEFAKTTPQDPVFHQEGDVWTHTVMVCDSLVNSPDYQSFNRTNQVTVFLAALLHDVAKYSTTIIEESGSIRQPGHSAKGAVDARVALWKHGAPIAIREHVARMIRVHQVPFYALGTSRKGLDPEFIVRELSHQLDIRLLAALAEADIRGRICPDAQKILDDIELFRIMAKEEDCFGQEKAFATRHTAVKYFRGTTVHPDFDLYQEPGSSVILMSGLPASGKDTWVSTHCPHLPVISFDDAREELGLRHGKNEGMVAHHAIDQAKALLRKREPFVWNATHLTDQMRGKSLNLCFAYNAEVEIVHLEKPLPELLRRNNKRDTSLTNKTLEGMLNKWEAPLPTEAHRVTFLE